MDINESPDPQQQQQQSQQQSQQQLFHRTTNNGFQQSTSSIDGDYGFMNNVNMNNTTSTAATIRGRNPQNDLDSSLLQQFSCLGTTDHEDLINELIKIMDNQLPREGAKFFLEMSNWNIPVAIGYYMDLFDCPRLPSMKIVEQKYLSEYKQAWKLENNGDEIWPSGCYLMSPNQTRRLDVPQIRPGETCDIVADIPPSSPAIYWRLCAPNGWYFGDTIWMIPDRFDEPTSDLAQRMAQLRTSSSTSMSAENCPQVNIEVLLGMND